jgi:hypothetical protein
LFLDKRGHLIDGKTGAYWGRSAMKRMLAQDAAMPEASSGPRKPVNHHASAARVELNSALQKLCSALGLEHEEVAGQIGDILDEHERVQIQEYAASLGGGKGAGKGAIDKSKAALDDDDEDLNDFADNVRKFRMAKGLDPTSVEQAVEIAIRNRAAGVDERPNNAIGGGPPIKERTAEDLETEYPGISDYPDTMTLGELDPERNAPAPGYRPSVREASLRAMNRVAGKGVGIRLQTPGHDEALAYPDYGPDPDRFAPPRGLAGDAALEASDAEMEKSYPGFSAVKTSVFG